MPQLDRQFFRRLFDTGVISSIVLTEFKGKKVIGDTMKGLGWVVATAATIKAAYEIGKTVYEHLPIPKQSMMMHP